MRHLPSLAVALLCVSLLANSAPAQNDSPQNHPVSPEGPEGANGPEAVDHTQARRDRYGDPLPRGALIRLGTVRLQHDGEITSGFFSSDGKTLTTAGQDYCVRRWDVATGKELPGSPIQLRNHENHRGPRVSPDGKTVATFHMQDTGGGGSITTVCLWDLATGKYRRLEGNAKKNETFLGMDFSPDGALLAAACLHGDIFLWAVPSGKLVRRIAGGQGSMPSLAFSPASDLLAIAITERSPQPPSDSEAIVVYEVATGSKVHRLQVGPRKASMSFSPDGKKLAVAGSPVRVWNLAGGKAILEVNLDERVDLGGSSTTTFLPRSIAYSPDGKRLAVNVSGTVTVVEASNGKKIYTVLGDRRAYKRMFFSPDGQHLAVPGQTNLYVYETATGKPLHGEGHRGAVNAVAFAPDGKTLITSDLGAVRLWDGASGKEIRRWPSYFVRSQASAAFSPDGKLLAHAGGAAIRLWNPATGEELPQFRSLQASGVAFSPDGALLAALSGIGPGLWDVATGKNVRQIALGQSGTDLAYSPDGKTLALGGGALWLWDADTGKQRHKIEPPGTAERSPSALYGNLAFSPDGAYVAAYGGWRRPTDTRALNLYDVGSGKQVGQFQTAECQRCHMTLAYSPDGKTLATGDSGNAITLWEVITGKQRAKLTGHRRYMEGLAFAPDGQRLASASADGTALLWDLREAANPAPIATDAIWQGLASEDAAKAYDVVQALVRKPVEAIPLLRNRLKPVAAVEPRRLEVLVAELESDTFAARERATAELEKLGDQAESALRKTLTAKLSVETGQRIENLLALLAPVQVSAPNLLACLRGVEALEHMGTAEAKELLTTLAGGAPEARLTREAKAALARLTRRSRTS